MSQADEETPYLSKSSGLLPKIQLILMLPLVLVLAIVADYLGIEWARG